jgi:hypothetical protein
MDDEMSDRELLMAADELLLEFKLLMVRMEHREAPPFGEIFSVVVDRLPSIIVVFERFCALLSERLGMTPQP